jgi:hypothetical protein
MPFEISAFLEINFNNINIKKISLMVMYLVWALQKTVLSWMCFLLNRTDLQNIRKLINCFLIIHNIAFPKYMVSLYSDSVRFQ